MASGIGFASPRNAATAMNLYASQKVQSFTARPWNRTDPERTNWWLVPSKDWPAYHHGKLCFRTEPDRADEILLGLHLEKGLSEAATSFFVTAAGKRLAMGDDWRWHDLARARELQSLLEACDKAHEAMGQPLAVLVGSGPVSEPGDDESRFGSADSWDELDFDYSRGSISAPTRSRLQVGALAGCSTPSSLEDLFQQVQKVDGWYWVDVYLGFFLRCVEDEDAYPVASIWENAIAPWLRWVK